MTLNDDGAHVRLFRELSAQPSPTRSHARAIAYGAMGTAASFSLSIFFLMGGLRQGPRPTTLVLLTSMGAALLAVIAARVAWSRGGRMLGRPAQALWLVIAMAPLTLFLWRYGVSDAFGMTEEWLDRPGWRCFRWSLAMGAAPFAALFYLRRDTELVHPALVGTAMGIAVGALVWVPVDLWCPVAYAPHLILGHVLPMLIFGAVGALLGRYLLVMRG